MNPRSKLLAVLLTGLAITAPHSIACSCDKPGSPIQELQSSSAVFSGRAISVFPLLSGHLILFHVDTTWKGVKFSVAFVVTPPENGACGFPFRNGGKYLVYADGRLIRSTGICYRTSLLSDAALDLAALGEGQRPWSVVLPISVTVLLPTALIFWNRSKGRLLRTHPITK
jgi:hypothetical protein